MRNEIRKQLAPLDASIEKSISHRIEQHTWTLVKSKTNELTKEFAERENVDEKKLKFYRWRHKWK